MTMDQAATFLAGSVLTMLGFIVIIVGIVIVNNVLHKYWKPITFFKWIDYPTARFIEPQEEVKDTK